MRHRPRESPGPSLPQLTQIRVSPCGVEDAAKDALTAPLLGAGDMRRILQRVVESNLDLLARQVQGTGVHTTLPMPEGVYEYLLPAELRVDLAGRLHSPGSTADRLRPVTVTLVCNARYGYIDLLEQDQNGRWHPEPFGQLIENVLEKSFRAFNAELRNSLRLIDLYPTGISAQGAEMPRDQRGLVDLRRLLVNPEPARGAELKAEIHSYITRMIGLEGDGAAAKREHALRNLERPELLPYMEQARRHNVLLIFSRAIEPELFDTKYRPYLDSLMAKFNKLPPELLWEIIGAVPFEVTRTEDCFGFQKLANADLEGAGMGVSIMAGSRMVLEGDPVEYDEERLLRTVVHEILGHKRSLSRRPVVAIEDGRLARADGRWEIIMPRWAWQQVGVANHTNSLIEMNDDMREAIDKHYSLDWKRWKVAMTDLPEDPRRLLQLLFNLYRHPFTYYSDILEVVARSVEGDDLRKPLPGEGFPRNGRHNLEATRTVLLAATGRVGVPVDPEEGVFLCYEYVTGAAPGGEFIPHYLRQCGSGTRPRWQEVYWVNDLKDAAGHWSERPTAAASLRPTPFGNLPRDVPAAVLDAAPELVAVEPRPIKMCDFALIVGRNAEGALLLFNGASGELLGSSNKSCIRLGRHADCEIVLDNASISRNHASLTESEGGWILRDLESRNGTFLGGTRIDQAPLCFEAIG